MRPAHVYEMLRILSREEPGIVRAFAGRELDEALTDARRYADERTDSGRMIAAVEVGPIRGSTDPRREREDEPTRPVPIEKP